MITFNLELIILHWTDSHLDLKSIIYKNFSIMFRISPIYYKKQNHLSNFDIQNHKTFRVLVLL